MSDFPESFCVGDGYLYVDVLLLHRIKEIVEIVEIVNTNTKKPVYVDWRNYNIHDMSLLALEIAYNEYILCKGIGEFNELITCYNLMKNNLPTHQASH